MVKEIRNGSVDWIHVAQDRNQRQVLADQRNFQLVENKLCKKHLALYI